jgi:raffinose/stachyose/melibiose transport system permease protein
VIDRREQVLAHLVLGVFAVIALAPVVKIVLGAGDLGAAWEEGNFGTYLRSSAIVTGSVVVISTVLSVLAGYAFGLMRFRGAEVLFYLFVLGLTVPLEAIVVPLYYDLRDVGMTDTYWALILPQAALSTAFGTFWMRAFFRSVPRSLIEAARLDGSSSWVTLWRIVLPLGRPAVLTMVVLVFMWTWNEFLLALVMVSDESLRTAPLGLAFFQGRNTSDEGLLTAGALIVAAPVVIVYLFLQRHFIRGMLSGAVKG